MEITRYLVDNRTGWEIELRRYSNPKLLRKERCPVIMFPGYCMNAFALSYHPSGVSMVEHMASHGYEVWTANLRGQGGARAIGTTERTTFSRIAREDVHTAIQFALQNTRTKRDSVVAAGASLGATFLFSHLATTPDTPISSIMSLGGPLRWVEYHPMVRVVFGSRRVAEKFAIPGTRKWASKILPVAMKVPSVLSLYMNTDRIDLSNLETLLETVDDPIPSLNAEIVQWIRTKDLFVDGINVSQAMSHVEIPLLQICANRDGIVPVATAKSAALLFGSEDVTSFVVGDARNWFAHADLFINDEAKKMVFDPMTKWLERVS